MVTVTDFIFLGSKITADSDCSHEIKRRLLLGRKAVTNIDSIIKKQRHYFANKGLYSQSYGFSSGYVRMWELDYKESWELKNWCFWAVVLEKTLESPSDSKIKPVNPKGNQSWIFIGRTDAEAPIFWPPDVKSQLMKTLMLGKIEGRRRRGWQRMRWLNGITDSVVMSLSMVKDREAWRATVHGVTKSWTWLRNNNLSRWTIYNSSWVASVSTHQSSLPYSTGEFTPPFFIHSATSD